MSSLVSTEDDNVICGACKKVFSDTGAVCCDYCGTWYHIPCSKISKTLQNVLDKASGKDTVKWKCDACTSSNSKELTLFAKLRNELKFMFSSSNNKLSDKIDDFGAQITKSFDTKLESHKKEVESNFNEVEKITSTHSVKIDEMQRELSSVKSQIDNMHRLNNLCCINISGIPQSNESGYDEKVVNNIANFLDVDLGSSGILFCRRLGKSDGKSPPILVRCVSRELAENLMSKYYAANSKLMLSDICDEKINQRVYINEQLTNNGLRIFRECYRLKKKGMLSKVYTRKGIVYAIVNEGVDRKLSKIETIESFNALAAELQNKNGKSATDNMPNGSITSSSQVEQRVNNNSSTQGSNTGNNKTTKEIQSSQRGPNPFSQRNTQNNSIDDAIQMLF